jgi:hypothetical protein
MSKKLNKEELSKKVSSHKLEMEAKPQNPHPTEEAQYKAKSGWGGMDSYAYAVKNTLDQARHMKGSDSSFLGVEKKLLDPKEQVDREMLVKKKKKE